MRRIGKQIKEEEKEGAGNLYLCDGGIKENESTQAGGGLGMVTMPNPLFKIL